MHTKSIVVIDFKEGGDTPWQLHISREENADALIFALHWGSKLEPTHVGVHHLDDFNKAMEPLLKPQVVT